MMVDWSLWRGLQQVRNRLQAYPTRGHIPIIPTICPPVRRLSLQGGASHLLQSRPCWLGHSLLYRVNHFSGYLATVDPRTAYYPTPGTYQPISATQNMADTSNVMAVPYSTAPVPTTYTHYQGPHYVDLSTAEQYCQSVMYDAAAPVYATALQFSHPPSKPPQANRAPLTPPGTPNCTVFLSKLPYTATGQVVRHFLEEFGTVAHCVVPLDRTCLDKIQGTAIVTFNEPNDAARAIRSLDGAKWKGVTISARWDRESEGIRSGSSIPDRLLPASQTGTNTEARRADGEVRDQWRRVSDGPLIVNGSRSNIAPSRSRRRSRLDDSDGSEYDDDDEGDSSNDGTSL
jgi:hypothetical protein